MASWQSIALSRFSCETVFIHERLWDCICLWFCLFPSMLVMLHYMHFCFSLSLSLPLRLPRYAVLTSCFASCISFCVSLCPSLFCTFFPVSYFASPSPHLRVSSFLPAVYFIFFCIHSLFCPFPPQTLLMALSCCFCWACCCERFLMVLLSSLPSVSLNWL